MEYKRYNEWTRMGDGAQEMVVADCVIQSMLALQHLCLGWLNFKVVVSWLILFIGWVFYFLFSVFLLDFQCSDCVLTDFFGLVNCLFTVKVCWCWRLGIWNKLGKRILEAKVFVISWGCTQRKKVDYIRFSATNLGMSLGELDLRRSWTAYLLFWKHQPLG